MNMFRTAVLKVMTDPSGNDVEGMYVRSLRFGMWYLQR